MDSSISENDPACRGQSQEERASVDETSKKQLDPNRIVRHILVIGFHHKHGYQVDYCYPPLSPGGPQFSTSSKPITLPNSWKMLPLLCLPDGSHNYDSDTIYFTMPDIETNIESSDKSSTGDEQPQETINPAAEGIKTIFGTACYRQIQADKLVNRTDDMTRIAVQKSVCVLSTKPLFGLFRSKLEMITHAYFDELDFSKVSILKLTYENLNSLLDRDSIKENATYLGLSARYLVSQFGYNTLVLFKAMLLEKKILFYKSPVRDLCSTILTMCSLFTGLLECGGLDYSTCDLKLSAQMLEALRLLPQSNSDEIYTCDELKPQPREDKVFFSPSKEQVVIISESHSNDLNKSSEQSTSLDNASSELTIQTSSSGMGISRSDQSNDGLMQTGEFEIINDVDEERDSLTPNSNEALIDDQNAMKLSRMKPEDLGLPLRIFTRGSFCLPYLSITYLDLLADARIKGYVIGATNFLFKQKRDMYDVIVDMEENNIIINDVNLKRCLTLTTEDLRFMDNISRQVRIDPNQTWNEFDLMSQDITKWVGGDEWIRYHFKLYTLYLLKTSKSLTGWESFNKSFIQAWRQTTNNYKIWDATGKSSILDNLKCRHPSSYPAKGINFGDMKLKLSYAVNSSEKGRMINQTLNGIGKWTIWNDIASVAAAATSSAAATISSASSQIVTNAKIPNITKGTSSEPISNVTKDEDI